MVRDDKAEPEAGAAVVDAQGESADDNRAERVEHEPVAVSGDEDKDAPAARLDDGAGR